jgi:hypothetical protein
VQSAAAGAQAIQPTVEAAGAAACTKPPAGRCASAGSKADERRATFIF